ncbi:MAG: ATP synthase F0 subunit C [Deltaproteobacteria bacterium]|jgi:F-type H+-transporting ATPase subunit c|nr:ATP synthase F0 subunit C [Deltaproteobacteria bacterium]
MKKPLVFLLTFLAVGSVSALALAADPTVTVEALKTVSTIALASALGIGIGVLGPGLAQGLAVYGTAVSIARNPEIAGFLRVCMIIGLAFIESLAIYVLVVALVLIYAFPFNEQVLKLISG